MSQDFSKRLQQKQNLTLGDMSVEGAGHYIDFSQKQIIYISVDEIKTREFIKTSPYKGLKRFESNEWDVKRFFGRTQFIDSLLTELNESNLILLLGASGSGKSSVVRAGLIPWLEKQSGANFVCLTFSPDKDPFESLYVSLVSQFGQADAQVARKATSETLVQVVQALKKTTSHWFIFIDQFEELFTITQPEKRDQFFSGLVRLVKELDKTQNPSVNLVAAMRADFLDQLSPYRDLIRITDKYRPMIAEMHPDELRLAIEQPAAHHGVVFEEGLVEEIIKDVWGQAGYLPLLQYTLNLLWETEVKHSSIHARTLNTYTYRTLGGVRGALQKHVDEIYEALSISEKSVIQRIFLKLVSIGEDKESGAEWKPVRRRAPLAEFNEPLEQQVLKQLVDFNLLVSNHPTEFQDATIETAHESLLTSWTRLNTWIKENRQAIMLRNRLNDDVARWQHNKNEDELWAGSKLEQVLELRRDETFNQVLGGLSHSANQFIDTSLVLQERRVRRTIIGLVSFSVVALLLVSVSGWQWRTAKINELETLSSNSDSLFSSGQEFNALLVSMRGADILNQLAWLRLNANTKNQIVATLAQAIYGVAEHNHFNNSSFGSLSPNGETIVSFNEQTSKIDLHTIDGKLIKSFTIPCKPRTLRWSPDSKIIAVGGSRQEGDVANCSINLFNTGGKLLQTLSVNDGTVDDLSWSSNSQALAIARDISLEVWSLDAKEPNTFSGHKNLVYAVNWSPNGEIIASGSKDRTVRLWSSSGKLLRILPSPEVDNSAYLGSTTGSIYSLDWSLDSRLLAAGGNDKTIQLWSSSGDLVANLRGHNSLITALRWSIYEHKIDEDNYPVLASGDSDGMVKIWAYTGSPPFWQLLKSLQAHSSTVANLSWSPSGKTLISSGADLIVKRWNLEGILANNIKQVEDKNQFNSYSKTRKIISPSGLIAASLINEDRQVEMRTLAGDLLAVIPSNLTDIEQINYFSWSSNSEVLLTVHSESGTANLWAPNGQLIKMVPIGNFTELVCWHPTDKLVASYSAGAIRIWGVDGHILKLIPMQNRIQDIAWHPDGKLIASLDSYDSVILSTLNKTTTRTIRLARFDSLFNRTIGNYAARFNNIEWDSEGEVLIATGYDSIAKINLNLEQLVKQGCDWLIDFLKTNQSLSENERQICNSR